MANVPDPSFDRRALLRNGGIVLAFGAVVAACGDTGGLDAPGRLGVAPPPPTLPEGDVDDGVLLRTAQSIEYTAIEVYEAALELEALSDAEVELINRFVEDHRRHADDIGALVQQAGAEEFRCANPFLVERAVEPLLAAFEGTDDLRRDVLNVAHGFETLAGASYQALVAELSEPSLRSAAMVIGGEEHRHAAALAAVLNPDELINPVLLEGDAVDTDAEGFPVPYAIPATVGQLTGINLVVGGVDDEGGRVAIQLQTPAANTFVYDYLSCS